MEKILKTRNGNLNLPVFLPDATYGSIKTLSFSDVKKTGTQGIVSTTLHLENKVGSRYIKDLGGLHKFMGWNKPILTDSGGWQVFSLINSGTKNNKKMGAVSELGCTFIDPATGSSMLLTPESSIQIQSNLGSDIMTVLDDPIIGDASLAERKESVRITTNWAKRSKKMFEKIYSVSNSDNTDIGLKRPLLGAVVQGADDFENRRISAEQLIEIGFDLYNFGGIPTYKGFSWKDDEKKGFYHEMLHYVSELLPKDKYKYAMGIGQPDDIAFCVEHGWNIFDTVLPTRNARHGYLYVSEGKGDVTKGWGSFRYDILHLKSDRYKFDQNPIDENLLIPETENISRAYLRHLVRINESAGQRIATLHNLYFYTKWMEKITDHVNL